MDRKAVYEFLDDLTSGESLEEKIAILKDILVDDFCFQGVPEQLSDLEAEISHMLKNNPTGNKINAIRVCRERTGLGLKEAKEYVESFIPGYPTYGNTSVRNVLQLTSRHQEQMNANLAARLNAIAAKYGRPGPF